MQSCTKRNITRPVRSSSSARRKKKRTKLSFSFLEQRSMMAGDIQGSVFHDLNANGINDAEPGYADVTVYLDANRNSSLDAGEASATTDSLGAYSFTNVEDGAYSVAHLAPSGAIQISSSALRGLGIGGQAVDALAGHGVDPVGLAWGNGTLYQVDRGTGATDPNTVYRINPSTGESFGSFPAPAEVLRLTFDGVDLWGADSTNNRIYRFSTDGAVQQQITPPASGSGTVAWDAERGSLWVGSINTDVIYELNPSDGTVKSSIPAPHQNVVGLAFDGRSLWVSGQFSTNGADAATYQVDPANGQVLRSFVTPHSDGGARFTSGLTFDGRYLWSIDRNSRTLVQFDPGVTESHELTVAGSTVTADDFGLFQLGSVAGQVTTDGSGAEGWRAYLDLDNNGAFQPWEPTALTDASGNYLLNGLRPGAEKLAEVVRGPSFSQIAPAGGTYDLNIISSGQSETGRDFANHLPAGEVGAAGAETLVNTTTVGSQVLPNGYNAASVQSVAMDSSGNYVVVWEGTGPGDADGIFARRFGSDGTPLSGEFRVNIATAGRQWNPMVAMSNDGKFVIVWGSGGTGFDNGGRVIGQMYSSSGAPVGSQFTVATSGNGSSARLRSVAMDDDGDFVVLYHMSQTKGSAFHFQRYNALAQAQGKAVKVLEQSGVTSASVAMDADGDFAVAMPISGISVQRYSKLGLKQGGLINVSSTANVYPSIVMDAAGNFLVGWNSGDRVVAQRYSSSGAPVGGIITSAVVSSNNYAPAIAMEADGDFIVMAPAVENPQAQRFTAAGVPVDAAPFAVATTLNGSQLAGSVAVDGSGRFVIAWTGSGIGDDAGVFVQRYAAADELFSASSFAADDSDLLLAMALSGDSAESQSMSRQIHDQYFAETSDPKQVPFKERLLFTGMNPELGEAYYVGHATHAGKVSATETFNPDFNPADPESVFATYVKVAANGDTLFGRIIPDDPANPFTTGTLTIDGGTGRFEGATGTSSYRVTTDPDGSVLVLVEGTITSVGSH